MNVSKRYLPVVLSALCGCTPTARLTNLTPQTPIPEDSVRIVQTVESPDSTRKIADFRILPIRMRGTARRAERDITRPLRQAAARNGPSWPSCEPVRRHASSGDADTQRRGRC